MTVRRRPRWLVVTLLIVWFLACSWFGVNALNDRYLRVYCYRGMDVPTTPYVCVNNPDADFIYWRNPARPTGPR